MNHIYKVVWSKVRNCYMAVSEIAKGHGKKSPSEKWGGKKAALLAAVILTLGIGGTVGAAGPAAIENGTASKADGIASIAVGVGDQVNSKSTYQGATSIAVGTLNVIDADENSPYDGAASSVVGQANYTKNANAAVIMGAGNKVTNSYREVKLDEKTLQELKQAYQKKDMQKVTAILQKAVPESGGQVMVMGGGNTVDYAQASQVMGVSNTLTGTKDAVSQYNLVDGFKNDVSNVKRTAIVGTGNTVQNGEDNVVIGDYHQLDGGKHNVILGSMASKEQEVTKTTQSAWIKSVAPDGTVEYKVKEQVPVKANTSNIENAVMLGYNTDVSESGGVALGSGSIASVKAGVFGWDPSTKAASTTDSNVWKSSWAAVSVGDAANKFTRQITNVAAGYNDTDAVNVAQLKAAMDNAGSKISLVAGDGIKIEGKDGTYTISANITGGKTATDTTKVDGKTGTSGDSGSTDKGNTDASGNGKQLVVTTDTNPTMFAADEGTAAEVKPSETLTINGDKTNIATKVNGNAISVKLKDDISVKTVNATSVTATDSIGIKDGPSMTTNGIDAAGKKITHVAAGTEATDAVNYGQLKDVESKVDSNSQAITNINSHVNRLDNRINKVGAGAAALAGLHPLDFDPADKWNFAVGYGNYRNANSVAVGAFYRPNGDTMVSVGTNFGNGENMVNAGVSFKLGQGSSYAGVSKAELAEENQKLKANDAAQDQKIQNQEKEIQELKKALEELKSHIK